MAFAIESIRAIVVLSLVSNIQRVYSGDQFDLNVCSYKGICRKTTTIYGYTIHKKYQCKKYEQCETTWGRWSPCMESRDRRKRVGKCIGTNCHKWKKDEETCPPPPTTTVPTVSTTPTVFGTFPATNASTTSPTLLRTLCYTLAGSGGEETCFENDPPFDNAQGYLPESPSRIGTRFILFTRSEVKEEIDLDNLASSSTLAKRDTKVIIHGYTESENAAWIQPMVLALLGVGDFNVIVVDWKNGANKVNYYRSVANTRLVGAQVGFLVKALEDQLDIARADVHIIGLSLGAHTAGYAGKSLAGIGRISGLDPAGPAFYLDNSKIRLSRDDALYVDALHTNGGTNLLNGLGIFQPVGHSNFYPNGGKQQPGCLAFANFTDTFSEVPTIYLEYLFFSSLVVGCSHMRSAYLYIESIKGSCPFQGYPCELEQIENKTAPEACIDCGAEGCARTGYYSLDDRANVNYYLTTTRRQPFC